MTLPMSLKNIQELIYEKLKIKRSTSTIREWMNEAGVQPIRTRPRLYHPSDVSQVLWGNKKPKKVETISRRKRSIKPIKSNGIYAVLPKQK
ncbi:MAG: hypothetical protein ACFFDN_13585 [Candidatus Hodarchaeota archaeon]